MITALKRLFAANSIERQLYPVPKIPLSFRTYIDADFDQCVAIHDANAEGRFPVGSRPDFLDYLNQSPKGLVIAESEGKIAGLGGLTSVSDNVHILCYGMVHPEFQGHGIGSTLTLLRLQKTSEITDKHFTFIFAVRQSITFYERFGFRNQTSWKGPDGKDYPVGLVTYWSHQLRRVSKVLEQRKHYVRGNFRADPSKKLDARITEIAEDQYRVELIEKRKPEDRTSASSQ